MLTGMFVGGVRGTGLEAARSWLGTSPQMTTIFIEKATWADWKGELAFNATAAKAQGIEFEKAVFPWAASGRALATARDEGMTKLLFDKATHRLLGAGIVGPNAGELISETVLALEMGADAQDIGLTIHPHPTLSETVFFSAEIADGSITDLYMPKR